VNSSSCWNRYEIVTLLLLFFCQLEIAKYGQLPPLPPKSLPFMNADASAINQRTFELGQILVRLAARADTRQSQPFRAFIDFDSHTSFSVSLHELGRGRTTVDPRFGLVGVHTVGEYLVAVHTDTTSLSRLGKVWSVVEADELGQLGIWKISRSPLRRLNHDDEGEALGLGEKLFTSVLSEKVHGFKMNREGKFFIGLASGVIKGIDIQTPTKAYVSIAAHGNSPVVALDLLSDDTIISISLDGALRISSATSGNLIGGGKLTKRLGDDETLTCLHVHAGSGRVFLGTDKGRVLILDVSSGSPSFLHALTMNAYPVNCFATGEDSILIGAGTVLSHYSLPEKGKEAQMIRTYQIFTYNKANVQSCMFLPNSQGLVVAGHGDGCVAFYSKQALVYSRIFAFEQINALHYADGTLWAGSDDGRIIEVIIPGTLSEDTAYASSFVVREEQAVKPLATTAVAKKDVSPVAKANPNCLKKSAALADDDSDDDWKKGLFSN